MNTEDIILSELRALRVEIKEIRDKNFESCERLTKIETKASVYGTLSGIVASLLFSSMRIFK